MPPPNRVTNPRDSDVFGSTNRTKVPGGIAMGIVIGVTDPDGRGRVQITLPWLPVASSIWARVVTAPGSGTAGGYQIGDAVVVAFEQGEIHFPFVIGRLSS